MCGQIVVVSSACDWLRANTHFIISSPSTSSFSHGDTLKTCGSVNQSGRGSAGAGVGGGAGAAVVKHMCSDPSPPAPVTVFTFAVTPASPSGSEVL